MLAIIDGDVLAYQACRARWGNTITQDNVRVRELDDDGRIIQDAYSKEQDAQYMRDSWKNFQQDLGDLLETVFADDYVMAVKGDGDFRKLLYPDYKMNRHGDDVAKRYISDFVPAIRQLAVLSDIAIPANMCEADDLVRIWAEEARAAGQDFVICSIDKDLRCIPGLHYVMHTDPKKRGPLTVTEDEATRFYYAQLIMGDPTDKIPGVPRVGPVKANAMIAGCESVEEMQEAVVRAYLKAYPIEEHGPNGWFEQFLLNGKLIHIQTRWDDYFECHKWPIIQELRG